MHYKETIIELVGKIQSEKILKRIYKFVLYLYTHETGSCKRLSVFFVIRSQRNVIINKSVKCLNISIRGIQESFYHIFARFILTRHDAVDSFKKVIVGLDEHFSLSSSQPHIINTELSTNRFDICISQRVFSAFNKTDSTLFQTNSLTEFFHCKIDFFRLANFLDTFTLRHQFHLPPMYLCNKDSTGRTENQ